VSGRWLYEQARKLLTEGVPWEFPHHLGHGTGLSIHEAPHLNPHWDDWLKRGDLFTVEPGLYGPDLAGGVRIEDNYWIGPDGLTKLSHYPRGLVLPGR
jgi:Xaa-Pro dipeptidase